MRMIDGSGGEYAAKGKRERVCQEIKGLMQAYSF